MHKGISISTNHLYPWMLYCPMILALSAHLIRSSLPLSTCTLVVIDDVDNLDPIQYLLNHYYWCHWQASWTNQLHSDVSSLWRDAFIVLGI